MISMAKTVAIQQSLDAMGELLIWTDIAAEKEDDFNQWYDTEHMQERASISGFQWSRRYIIQILPSALISLCIVPIRFMYSEVSLTVKPLKIRRLGQ
jgi:hypothetical protein